MATLPDNIPEILAPAGGRAQFFAALNAGADAVYLGLKSFNARARAENFTPEDLRELVPLAHDYGMQVLITLNVLIKDQELEDLIRTMAVLEELEVDAVIVQDLGVARIARAHFPQLRLHASTQMAVHNLAGVEKAKELGFRRVVLARELTATEIRKIRAKVPREEVELEVFCHGSLCYSYSGLCFFSGAEDARSGNRGECAYTCRQPYKIVSEEGQGFLFSMRDLDTSKTLDLLATAGVDTLKIEGRKKDAQYVASTVTLYRKKLDELFGFPTLRASAPKKAQSYVASVGGGVEEDLALSFHRQKTSFFVQGRYHENVIDLENPTHVGLEIGEIRAVEGNRVQVRTASDLERFDGLRIVEPRRGLAANRRKWENDRLEFSLRDLRVGGRWTATAKRGDVVEIQLLEGTSPLPEVGDLIHKVRSADLKRRVEDLAHAPEEAKPRAVRQIETEVRVEPAGDVLLVAARCSKFGHVLAQAEVTLPMEKAKSPGSLAADVEQAFAWFGDQGFRSTAVTLTGDAGWFVPRSKLKSLKQTLSRDLAAAYLSFVEGRVGKALSALAKDRHPLPPKAEPDARTFNVKADQIATLKEAVVFAREHPDFRLTELTFEPKRALLSDLDPEALADSLKALSDEAGIPVRLAIPTVVRAWDEPLLKRWFGAAVAKGLASFEVGNLGAFRLIDEWGLRTAETTLATDFTLYSLNSCTNRFWQELGASRVCLSLEDDAANLASQVARLAPEERRRLQVIVYKDTPLFIAEACSLTALHNGCPTAKVCGYRTLEVENPKGERFFVAHESCKSIVYGKDAYSLSGKQRRLLDLGLTAMRVDFLTRPYGPADVRRILSHVLRAEDVADTHSANFDRTLL